MQKYFLFIGVIALISLSSSSTNAQSRARISIQTTQAQVTTKAELQKELKAFSKAYQNKTDKTAAAKKKVLKNYQTNSLKASKGKDQ